MQAWQVPYLKFCNLYCAHRSNELCNYPQRLNTHLGQVSHDDEKVLSHIAILSVNF